MKILNLTQHDATADQIAAGVLPAGCEKEEVRELLTFDSLPSREWIEAKAQALADVARAHGPLIDAVMIGGAPYLMGPLERALKAQSIKALYAFSLRESGETPDGEGGVRKTTVFKHAGFIEA